jgi:RimJ/RimL family protein N-acetyltransferase
MDSFTTSRLKATRLTREELRNLVQLNLDADVSRFLGGVRTPAQTIAYMETSLRHWADHGLGLWALRTYDGAFVGRAGLRHVKLEGVAELEVAYTFTRNAWGQGFGSEITKALVGIWRVQCSQPSLVGIVVKGNLASERVLLKTGFSYERDALFHEADCRVFRRVR